jgi:hypothetical protein
VNHTQKIMVGQPIFTTSSKKNIWIQELWRELWAELTRQ